MLSLQLRGLTLGAVLRQTVHAGHETSRDVQEVISSLISVGEGGVCLFYCLLPLHLLTDL